MKGDVVAVFPDSAHKTPEAASGTRGGGGRLSGGFCENTEPSAVWNRTSASENGDVFARDYHAVPTPVSRLIRSDFGGLQSALQEYCEGLAVLENGPDSGTWKAMAKEKWAGS